MAYASYIGPNAKLQRIEIVPGKTKGYKVQIVYDIGRKTFSRPGTRDCAEADLVRAAEQYGCVALPKQNFAYVRST